MIELNAFGEGAEFNHVGLALQFIKDIVVDVKSVRDENKRFLAFLYNRTFGLVELLEK